MPYILKRRTQTGEIRHQARVFAGKDEAGRAIMLVETFATRKAAQAWAAEKMGERRQGTLVVNTFTMNNLLDDLDRYYKTRHRSAWGPLIIKAHLRPYFGSMRADRVTSGVIDSYIASRQAKGRKDPTINRELGALERAFRLAQQSTPPKVSHIPRMPHLKESEPRQGFFEDHEYRALLAALPEEIRPVLTFAYFTGARKSEILHLRWDQVDLEGTHMVRLTADQTKAKTARTIPLAPDLLETLRMQQDIRDRWHPRCPHVFFRHATGKRLINFSRAWWNACKSAGLWDAAAGMLDKDGKPKGRPTKILHDNRRTAVRNLTRAGNTEAVAMKISGHKTASVFRRYNIVSEADLAEAARRLGAHIDAKRSSTPVVHGAQEGAPGIAANASNRFN
jgi:integrase